MGKQKNRKIPVKTEAEKAEEIREEIKNTAGGAPGEEPVIETPQDETKAKETTEEETPVEMILLPKAEVEELKKQVQENLDSWQRERADFSNFRKRVERDREIAAANYKADVLKKFLEVSDNLELAYRNIPQDDKTAAWAEGITNIIRKFNTLFENEGLVRMNLEPGMEFDPNLAMAVSSEETDAYESGQIIEVFQDGYRMGDRVVRQAIVRVAA